MTKYIGEKGFIAAVAGGEGSQATISYYEWKENYDIIVNSESVESMLKILFYFT